MTKYGRPQVVVFPVILITAMVICLLAGKGRLPPGVIVFAETILAVVLVWTLSFFRDPYRAVPDDDNLLLAPADGKISDIEVVEHDFIDGPALRIGIFLSVFNVHINRAPCKVRVEKIRYKKGKYKNAMSIESGRVNEANDLYLVRCGGGQERLILRQISGAIARRIVCRADEGQILAGGEKFGMIKFGSRTELYLPVHEEAECLVKIGDKVKAGLTPIVRYNK